MNRSETARINELLRNRWMFWKLIKTKDRRMNEDMSNWERVEEEEQYLREEFGVRVDRFNKVCLYLEFGVRLDRFYKVCLYLLYLLCSCLL